VRPPHGASYLLYNVHIDGLYHCSLRYKQLLHLHQALSKKFGSSSGGPAHQQHPLPPFPPKKLLPLSASRIEERRQLLEKYLQNISQDKTIANSTIFNMFLLEAQRESTRLVEPEKHVHLDIELVNGQKIRLPIVTHDSVDSVLTACCRALGLDDRYHAYFCLCLCGYDVVRDKLIIKRRLSFFEAPFITLQMAIQQQEQLQSVLSSNSTTTTIVKATQVSQTQVDSNNNNYHTRLTSSGYPNSSTANNTSLRNDSNANPCCCLSCSSQQQNHNKRATTGVPPISSSNNDHNSSYVDQQQQYQQQQSLTACNNSHYYYNGCNSSNGNQSMRCARSRSTGSPFVTHRILLRKSYWDPIYDTYILNDPQALNLLFIQTVYDMKHSLMFVDRDTYHQLETLLANDSKLEYILLARTLKYYNYVHFEPCYSDYPRPRTKVMISIGSKELNMRVLKTPRLAGDHHRSTGDDAGATSSNSSYHYQQAQQRQEPVLYCTSSLVPNGYRHLITKDDLIEEEYNFKVPLIRCWRLTSLETLNSTSQQQQQHRPTATTTLAGGKRKSLSLFNSVVGNSMSNRSAQARGGQSGSSTNGTGSGQLQGYGGQSLMSTLMASNVQRPPTGLSPSTAGIGSNSFFNFRRNGNQRSNTDDETNGNQHQCCQQENQHSQFAGQHLQQQAQQSVTNELVQEQTQLSQYELSFEYLIAKDTLKWITISSDQAIFISISLQGVVDELVSKRELGASMGDAHSLGAGDTASGHHSMSNSPPQVSRPISIRHKNADDEDDQLSESFTYMYQDGGQKLIRSKSQQMLDRFSGTSPPSLAASCNLAMARQHRIAGPAVGGNGLSAASSQTTRSSSSILQATGFWSSGQNVGDSSPGCPQFSRSSSSNLGLGSSYNSAAGSFEISQFNNKKVPSPIINDAFEGVVTNDEDL
jgi:hypothetical protein